MNPIIITYQKAKEEGLLIYFKDLHKGQILNCLLDFLDSQDLNEVQQKIIINYFPYNNSIEEIKTNSKSDDFKAVINFLKEGTSPNRHGTFKFTKLLLEYDIFLSKKSIDFNKENFNNATSNADIIKHISEIYLSDSNFSSIKINGDVDNKLGALSMDEYFIQLSYISYEDTHNRDSLLKLEKEYSYSKVYKSTINQNDLSQDYISESIIANNKVIISGNPGVGKSTYAKWLCYKWAKDFEISKNDKSLIYIQLRDLDFNKNDCLLDYIKNQYFSNIEIELTSFHKLDNFQLVLDGFDELPFENRIKLSSQINTFNYIVLSRPYGLINHELNYDVSIQIDGFNTNCIEQYLDKVLENQNKTTNLLKLINKNRVLKDYASTPLMLSYIALIYLTSKSIKKDLSSIQSVYDLQEKVFSWILDYALKKGSIKPELLHALSHQMEEFAYLMQINKQFVYSGNFDDKYSKTVEVLSAIGLGNQKRISENTFSWQFSFNTITFQEFLTARYLKEHKLNVEAIVYLVTDTFFWNLCLMLVGMLSGNRYDFNKQAKHSELLIQVLEFLNQFYSKHNHQYYGYAYYMLLAECSNEIVEKVIKEKDLKLMVSFYKNVYFDNFWNTIIYESINKIIYKLPYQIQVRFIYNLNEEISEISKTFNDEIDLEQNYFYLSDLIKIGVNYDETSILKSLIPVLIELKNKTSILSDETLSIENNFDENIEDEQLIKTYHLLTDEENWCRQTLSLYDELEFFSKEKLMPYQNEITTIYKEEYTTVQNLRKIIVKIAPKYSLIQLEEAYNALIKLKNESNIFESEALQKAYFNQTLQFSENLYIALNTKETFFKREEDKVSIYLNFLANDLLDGNNYDYISEYFLGHFIDVIIESITIINNPKLFNLLFDFVKELDAIIFSRLSNEAAFNNYVASVFKHVFKTLDLNVIAKLILILESSPNARFHFYNYRTSLFQVFKLLVEKNKTLLEGEAYNLNNKNYINVIDTLIEIVQLLEKSYDKKYFLEEIEKANLSFLYDLNNGDILKTIATNFIFYEDKYWKLFISFFAKNQWELNIVLPFIANEELFLFKSNHQCLVSVFIKLFENEANFSKKHLSEEGGNALVFTSHILMSLKHFESPDLKHKALKLIEKLLQNKDTLKFCKHEVIDLTPVQYILAYMLFYFYNSKDKEFLIQLDINTLLSKEIGAKTMLMDSLIEFAENKNYGIEIQDIEKFEPILGDSFYQELINLIKQRLINKNSFDSNYFETLIKF